jgi:hypothetical protein
MAQLFDAVSLLEELLAITQSLVFALSPYNPYFYIP